MKHERQIDKELRIIDCWYTILTDDYNANFGINQIQLFSTMIIS